ncbi:MAG: AAA family ATPase [Planctomycetota bacterium]|nr:AAA family ATPase [Planctomycetota bacterium]
MYEEHFGFRHPPFAATPDARCCFVPEALRATIDELVLRLDAGQGICVLTGAAGLGKTLINRVVASELDARFHVIRLATPGSLTRKALLQSLLSDLDRPQIDVDEQRLRLELVAALRQRLRADRPCVLLVDEAHTLSPRLFEELRSLAILDEQAQPLLRVMLSGQPKLEETLTAPEFDALNQQIVCHKLLESMTLTESVEYVLHRVAWAGGKPESLFSIPALDLIVRAAAGNPRLLNRLCDLSLILASAHDLPQVGHLEVESALSELRQLPLRWNEDLPDFQTMAARGDTRATNASTKFSPANEQNHENCLDGAGLEEEDPDGFPDDTLDEVDRSHHESFGEDPLAASEFILEDDTASATEDVEFAEDEDSESQWVAPFISDSLPASLDPQSDVDTRLIAESSTDAGFESVADPYAALDPQRPRLMRTYDDQAQAAVWNGRAKDAGSIPQLPPEPPSDLVFDELPVRDIPDVMANRIEGETSRGASDIAATAGSATPVLTRRATEGQLRSNVFDSAVDEYDVVEPESSALPPVRPAASVASMVNDAADDVAEEFGAGVIEERVEATHDDTPEIKSSRIASVHPAHPPAPPVASRTRGLGMLFSTLRRKLGK